MLATNLLAFSTSAQAISISDDLITHYKLDNFSGSVVDSAGSRHGTNRGATRGVPGKIGNAFEFDFVDDYVDLPGGMLAANSDFTVSAWINLGNGSYADSDWKYALDFRGDINNAVGVRNGKLTVISGQEITANSFDTVPIGEWHHIAYTYDDSQQRTRVFQNGQYLGSQAGNISPSTNGTLMNRMGAYSGSPHDWFDGKIDDVKIWDRALSSLEVAAVSLNTTTDNSRNYKTSKPIAHLAEWDGSQWNVVSENSLSSGYVHVLSHGWGRGEEVHDWVSENPNGKVWQMQNGEGGDYFSHMQYAAETIYNSYGNPDDVHVVAYSWIDHSATDAVSSRIISTDFGNGLANVLAKAGVGNENDGIHLLGHSHGARVATVAANKLERTGVQVDHLTLWDSPELNKDHPVGLRAILGFGSLAYNNLETELSKLDIGVGINQTFVDNYAASVVGATYENTTTNVRLDPASFEIGTVFDVPPSTQAHSWPIPWYSDASNHGLALNWSPLKSSIYTGLSPYYVQDAMDGFLLHPVETPIPLAEIVQEIVPVDISIVGTVIDFLTGKKMSENSPAYWDSILELSENNVSLQFDYEFLNLGDGDQLGVWIDDQLRTILTGNLAGTGLHTTTVDVSDLDAGSHLLTFALHNTGDVNAEVYVGNLQVISAIPEPSSILLVCIQATLLLDLCRYRKP